MALWDDIFLMNNVSKVERTSLLETTRRVSLLAQFDWLEDWMAFIADRQAIEQQDLDRVTAYYECT